MTSTVQFARRRMLLGVGLLAATSLTVAACGSSELPGSTDSSTSSSSSASVEADPVLVQALPEKVAQAGKIVVGTDATYAPNEFLAEDGTTIQGMDIDIFNAVAAQFGVEVEYQAASFDSIILGVSSGKYDVGVSSFTINDERKQQVNMVSYFSAGTQWVTAAGNPKNVNPDEACGLNIAVQKGTVQVDDLQARSTACTDAGNSAINQIVEQDQAKVTADVVSGKADAMLADSPIGLYAVKQTDGQLEAVGEIYDSAPYGFVVPKDQIEFADAMVTALQNADSDGSYSSALEKWGNESGAVTEFAVNP
ncbi:MAG: ABC transporter substrate-binding protein [Actinomycetales bacterium]